MYFVFKNLSIEKKWHAHQIAYIDHIFSICGFCLYKQKGTCIYY